MATLFNRISPALLIALALVATSGALAQGDLRYLALITDLKGEVQILRGGKASLVKAQWGTQLFEGDKIKTSEHASVMLLFSNNNLLDLGPGSTLTISEGPISGNRRPKTIKSLETETLADLSSLTMRTTSEGEEGALAGLRSAGFDQMIVPLSPRNSKVATTRPRFEWVSRRKADSYRVKVFSGSKLLWSVTTPHQNLDYPHTEIPLKNGEQYFWQVEGESVVQSFKSPSVGFTLLQSKDVESIESQVQQVKDLFKEDEESSSLHFILGSLYEKKGLFHDAIREFESIAKMNPNASVPYEVLGKLYTEIGMKDKAITALQKAVELSQTRE